MSTSPTAGDDNAFNDRINDCVPPSESASISTPKVLVEIVSATLNPSDKKLLCNTFCIVCDLPSSSSAVKAAAGVANATLVRRKKAKINVLHQTNTIAQNNSPIWTILDDSLCLLEINTLSNSEDGRKSTASAGHLIAEEGAIQFQVYHSPYENTRDVTDNANFLSSLSTHSYQYIGSIQLSKKTLLEGHGVRSEYKLRKDPSLITALERESKKSTHNVKKKNLSHNNNNSGNSSNNIAGTLALRFRIAHNHEVVFMNDKIKHQNNFSLRTTNTFSDILISTPEVNSNTAENIIASAKGLQPKSRHKPQRHKRQHWDKKSKLVPNVRYDTSGLKKSTIVNTGKPNDLSLETTPSTELPYPQNVLNYFKMKHRRIKSHKIRTKPYPDSSDVEGTRCLDPDEIEYQTLLPSKRWIEAGNGDLGTVYLEILKCDDLPNMDSGYFGDYTDAFVAIVFEDNLMRTDVIEDELSPRWLPWTQRAFAFPMKYPASPIFLGVFDRDQIGHHDHIGRIVINVSNFQDKTVYLLNYSLHSDLNQQYDRGTITVRLRVEWKNKNKKAKKSLENPSRKIFLNVTSLKAFRMVRYICRGEVNMEKPSMDSVKQYKKEIFTHLENLLYLADDVLRVLLWRGRIHVCLTKPRFSSMRIRKRGYRDQQRQEETFLIQDHDNDRALKLSLWFPIRSMLLFQTVIMMIEFPRLIPGLSFCFLGTILLRFMITRCLHPMPWNRCKNTLQILDDLFLGILKKDIYINQYDGYDLALEKVRKETAQIERVKNLFAAVNDFLTKSQSDFSKADMYAYLSSTEDKQLKSLSSNVMERVLVTPITYVHTILKASCEIIRMVRSLFTFESSYFSSMVMLGCFSMGLFLIFFPYEKLILWICRIVAWSLLSPTMKVIDYFYLQKYYPPVDDITDESIIPKLSFDHLFKSPYYKNLARKIKVAKEDGLKLEKMREYRFGTYIEEVPFVDLSLNPCIPLPTSTARPFRGNSRGSHHVDGKREGRHVKENRSSWNDDFGYEYLHQDELKWQTFSGQQLWGKMISHTQAETERD